MPRGFVACAVLGVVTLAGALSAGCASEPHLEDSVPAPARIALMPVENRSGVDLPRQPGLVWQSSEIVRMLLEMETSEAPLAVWPFTDAEPGELPAEVDERSALRHQLSFEPTEGVLRWRQTMMYEERQRLHALSDDPAWREAIDSLYAQSQRERYDLLKMLGDALESELSRRGYEVYRLEPEQVPLRMPHAERMALAHEATGAEHALLVVFDRWGASELFESGEISISATAAFVDTQTRELRWHRRLDSLRVRVVGDGKQDRASIHGVVDMRSAYPRLVQAVAVELLRRHD